MSSEKTQNIYAFILAGGTGSRIKSDIPKQFLEIKKIPVLIHTLEKFDIPSITGKIITMPEEFISYAENIIEKFSVSKLIKIIPGGKTRQGSVFNALNCINFNDDDIIICHDAARPFVRSEHILNCIDQAISSGASGLYVKAVDTIAKIDNEYISEIPPREQLYCTQTPQVFKYEILKKAHNIALSKGITNASDDVSLVLNAGYKVKITEGDYDNIKITTPTDLKIAEILISNNR